MLVLELTTGQFPTFWIFLVKENWRQGVFTKRVVFRWMTTWVRPSTCQLCFTWWWTCYHHITICRGTIYEIEKVTLLNSEVVRLYFVLA